MLVMIARQQTAAGRNAAKRRFAAASGIGSAGALPNTANMKINRTVVIGAALLLTSTLTSRLTLAASAEETAAAAGSLAPISYSNDGKLQYPADYRQWIYLSTGLDMNYNTALPPGHHMFGNVFVNPQAWKSFQRTGTWPDKTVLVLEFRGGEGKGSIIKGGQYQGSEVMGLEVHVRDDARVADRWAFYSFDDGKEAEVIPQSADCYACHKAHAAGDTTFVQFYPTLLELAASHKTLAPGYLEQK